MATEKFYTAIRKARKISRAKLGAFRSLLRQLNEQGGNVTPKEGKHTRRKNPPG